MSPACSADSNYWNDNSQFDAGVGYLFERGKKRQHRLDAAKSATAVTEAQVLDSQRTVLANTAQLFIAALLAKSNLEFAQSLFDSYKKTVQISEERHQAGAMSRNDLLKIQLQSLQFESDVSNAQLMPGTSAGVIAPVSWLRLGAARIRRGRKLGLRAGDRAGWKTCRLAPSATVPTCRRRSAA